MATYLPSKMNKTEGIAGEEMIPTHRHASVGQPARLTSALWGHRMQPRRPARRDG